MGTAGYGMLYRRRVVDEKEELNFPGPLVLVLSSVTSGSFRKELKAIAGDSSAKLASGSGESFARVQGLLTCFLALVSSLSRLSSY